MAGNRKDRHGDRGCNPLGYLEETLNLALASRRSLSNLFGSGDTRLVHSAGPLGDALAVRPGSPPTHPSVRYRYEPTSRNKPVPLEPNEYRPIEYHACERSRVPSRFHRQAGSLRIAHKHGDEQSDSGDVGSRGIGPGH